MLWISVTVALLFFSSCYALEGSTPVEAVKVIECEKSDLGFLLDVSGTFSTHRYNRAVNIIQDLTEAFDVKFGGSRAGVVTFSDEASTRIDFDRYRSRRRFNRGLRKLRQNGGRTRIDRGLDEATMVLFNQRYNWLGYKKYLFVLSDGKQTKINNKRPNLKERTWLLRHQGVHIIALAMGNQPRYYYLNQLVQYPEREVITITDRANIIEKVEQVRRIACSKPPAVPLHCEKMADIAFLLDMSSSIGGSRQFRHETNFVKSVLDNFSAKKNQIRAGVIVYGVKAQMKIKLNDYKKLDNFKKALEKVKYRGSQLTRIDRALDLAGKVLFTEGNGDRAEVPNYIVLITDGIQNSGVWDIDHNLAARFARPLWNRNITIFAVGVARASRRQLKQIAGKNGITIYRKRLRNLNDAANLIIPSQCKGCHKQANVAFLVDASGTSYHYFSRIKRLVYHIAEGFKQQRIRLQASVIRFSDEAVVDIHFGQFSELYSLQAELDTRVPAIGGRTYINKGLRAAEREFDKYAEKGVPKILVVITDGRQTEGNIGAVKLAAESLKQKGVHFVVVRISNCIDTICENTLKVISKERKKIINFSWNDNIINAAELVARSACP